jgi:hypothetical protein
LSYRDHHGASGGRRSSPLPQIALGTFDAGGKRDRCPFGDANSGERLLSVSQQERRPAPSPEHTTRLVVVGVADGRDDHGDLAPASRPGQETPELVTAALVKDVGLDRAGAVAAPSLSTGV